MHKTTGVFCPILLSAFMYLRRRGGHFILIALPAKRGKQASYTLMRLIAAMIGVVFQNHFSTIKLLGKHRAKQHMGPGRPSKGDLFIGLIS